RFCSGVHGKASASCLLFYCSPALVRLRRTTPYWHKFEPDDTTLAAFVQVFMQPLPPYLYALAHLA
ncbi:MAG TPA: hypothetical protein PLD73_19160, partial [Candidatus Hydrogenedentes bacterium]|nr:hypothetical protein [Candidatus Hydrogenedentota bacterium]